MSAAGARRRSWSWSWSAAGGAAGPLPQLAAPQRARVQLRAPRGLRHQARSRSAHTLLRFRSNKFFNFDIDAKIL